ncbi:hypothetical protein PVL29_008827 [Vitis rotundifolia]|uniref:Fold protein n=1 Tax=Vitis rotundifolia TaxID=103349 RepID=A0AA38ZXN8_VITRO|nr:hypothetical protein PVL29_008827 [Vitis rotundifolia]
MASPESMRNQSFFSHDDDCDDTDDGYVYGYGSGYELLHHPHNLSRLSMCTLNSMSLDEDEDDANGVGTSMMSIESFDGDADEELSDDKEGKEELGGLLSDSDKEPGCYSLPATPPRRRNRCGLLKVVGVKEYASENEAQKSSLKQRMKRRRAKVVREKREEKTWDNRKKKEEEGYGSVACGGGGFTSFSGESEGAGLVVITRPKGGRRPLCMDLEEVKACRDLGFELEHERMLEIPTRISISGSTLETSSGGNSPIASWRISSPGDDPRDVKARLKVWAQAVALASTSRHSC